MAKKTRRQLEEIIKNESLSVVITSDDTNATIEKKIEAARTEVITPTEPEVVKTDNAPRTVETPEGAPECFGKYPESPTASSPCVTCRVHRKCKLVK